GFPKVLTVAIRHHLDSRYQESFWEIALLVGSSTAMVAALHKKSDEMPENKQLETLGLSYSEQKIVFKKLSRDYVKTQELAKAMFV
ncbi:MAG TPA: hypothetical protein PKM20_09885, partial [Nitrosomonas sp.]|nr:hypothetical protein [Nitrosomonas sp.]